MFVTMFTIRVVSSFYPPPSKEALEDIQLDVITMHCCNAELDMEPEGGPHLLGDDKSRTPSDYSSDQLKANVDSNVSAQDCPKPRVKHLVSK
jgi:hypothetical protein